jgi:hypothetical protein
MVRVLVSDAFKAVLRAVGTPHRTVAGPAAGASGRTAAEDL